MEAWGADAASTTADVRWLVSDHLGTPRMVVDQTGRLAGVSRHDYFPFGEEIQGDPTWRTPARGYTGDGVRQKFALKEWDNETSLSYFIARYYSSTQGRFTSPDEFAGGPKELFGFAAKASANPTFYGDTSDPQTLNKYQYCIGNPLRYVDPDGHKIRLTNGATADRREVAGRLLFNLSKSERKYFTIAYDKKSGEYTLAASGGIDAALRQNHTAAFEKLAQTVKSPDTVRVAISETFTMKNGVEYTTQQFGGGVTLNKEQSVSREVETYLSREGNLEGVLGTDGKIISQPKSILAAHEVLGHARRLLAEPDNPDSYMERPAIDDENEIRLGRGRWFPQRGYDERP